MEIRKVIVEKDDTLEPGNLFRFKSIRFHHLEKQISIFVDSAKLTGTRTKRKYRNHYSRMPVCCIARLYCAIDSIILRPSRIY